MAKLNVSGVRQLALSIVAANPGGIRWADLLREIHNHHPETPGGTISGSCRNLDQLFPEKVARPERGLYKPLSPVDTQPLGSNDAEPVQITPGQPKVCENDFYDAFANWLRDDLDEVNRATAMGGSALGGKWSTPDVVGVYRPSASDIIKFQPEIVAAEIKIDPKQPVVAFGQAISYRLFSAKTYIAMPRALSEEDASRLEALCLLFGVGLVLFDLNPQEPNFSIRVRAQRFSPDMFYVNSFAERLKLVNHSVFEELFG